MEVYKLKISGDIHLLPPYAFMAQTGTSIHNRIIFVLVIHYVANYWICVWYVLLFILLILVMFGAVRRKIYTLGM